MYTSKNPILQEIDNCYAQIDKDKINLLKNEILSANRVFFIGAGRTKLMLSAFCIRLNHIGIEAYVSGSIPCPRANKNDLIIAASGSGRTPSVLSIVERINQEQIPIFFITANQDQLINKYTENILFINAPDNLERENNNYSSEQIMRTLFEQIVFLIGETITFEIIKSSCTKEIIARHTNLE